MGGGIVYIYIYTYLNESMISCEELFMYPIISHTQHHKFDVTLSTRQKKQPPPKQNKTTIINIIRITIYIYIPKQQKNKRTKKKKAKKRNAQ